LPTRRPPFAKSPGKHRLLDTRVADDPTHRLHSAEVLVATTATRDAGSSDCRATGFYNGKKESVQSDGVCDITRISGGGRQ
jgi:hypothetical protein